MGDAVDRMFDVMSDEIALLTGLTREMLAMLEELEWDVEFQQCHVCYGYQPHPTLPGTGHAPDCRLNALLTKAREAFAEVKDG